MWQHKGSSGVKSIGVKGVKSVKPFGKSELPVRLGKQVSAIKSSMKIPKMPSAKISSSVGRVRFPSSKAPSSKIPVIGSANSVTNYK